MINLKNDEFLSLLKAVKYTYTQAKKSDFSLSPRPCHNLVFFLEGCADIFTEKTNFSCQKGDILFIPQNTTYSAEWKAQPKTVFYSLHFQFSPSANPLSHVHLPVQKIPSVDFEKLYAYLQEIAQRQYKKNAEFYPALSAFFALLGDVFDVLQGERIKETETPVSPAIHYLKNHFKEKISVQELAQLCFLSESRFFYLFKKHTGVSPVTYKNRLAVFASCQALVANKQKSVEEIAEEFGFESAIYFRRLFKKMTGKTPSSYRKKENYL